MGRYLVLGLPGAEDVSGLFGVRVSVRNDQQPLERHANVEPLDRRLEQRLQHLRD
jgi:hypothetical protein